METDKRRAQFVNAALELYIEKGILRTSVGDISNRVGVTRSLFYHYFPNKEAITMAVVDDRVRDFATQFERWRMDYDPQKSAESLREIVVLLRTYLSDPNSFTSILARRNNNALLHLFTVKSAQYLSAHYAHMKRRPGSRTYVRHPRETFYILVEGLINFLSQYPDTSNDTLVEVIADTLNIPLGQ